MKTPRYFVLCLTLFFLESSFLHAQQLTATYVYEEENLGYRDEYTLHFNDGKSLYEHHHTFSKIINEKGWEFYFPHDYYDWYYDQSNKKITELKQLEKGMLLITNWDADFQWTIHDETKEINGYTVQKATGLSHNTKGRGQWDLGDVIAWFTTEIPIASGPEMYYGLPGLVIKLEFSKKPFTICTLKEITFTSNKEINWPDGHNAITVDKGQIFMPGLIDKKWLKQQKKLLKSKQ